MFSTLVVAAAAIVAVSAGPVPEKRTFHNAGAIPLIGALPPSAAFHGSFANPFQQVSLNNWGGFQHLNNFDNFFGVDNFAGGHHLANVVVKEQQQLVCHNLDVAIIQQQLAIVREYVKKIVTTQICEVEVQTIVFSQFQAGVFDFGHDLRHVSGRPIGFDDHIANQIVNLHDANGQLSGVDFGFQGADIGNNFVSPIGFNWNDATSPASVNAAFGAAQSAVLGGEVFTAPNVSIPGVSVPPPVSTDAAALAPPPSAFAVPPPVGGDSVDSSSVDPNPASD